MERYLKLENITMALGGQSNLPSAQELQAALAKTEVELFTGQGAVSDELLKAGWFLYSVASARKSLELYSSDRQRRAYQVASHIFDLALQSNHRDINDQLSLVFAAQVGFLKGDLNPNATAVYKRLNHVDTAVNIEDENLPLVIGTMFLAMDRPRLFRVLPHLRNKLASFESGKEGRLGMLSLLLDSCWDLLLYVSYGDKEAYLEALTLLEALVRSDVGLDDVDMRWVAAHLIDIANDFGSSSVWSMLPPDVPKEAARAMTLGSPPVLTLWPPQAQLIGSEDANNPLLLDTKRLFLSIPTSAGKTLLAQYISVAHLAQGGGGICFVAPTHSLCREIRKSLSGRLRLLKQQVAEEVPAGVWSLFDEDVDFEEGESSVEVMTPERLAFMLRYRPKETLDKFKLFIIDEAHLIAEDSRGLALESTLSLLNILTKNKNHRIILMSSSLGDGGHVVDWMGIEGANRTFHSEWRGPRRLYGIYSAERSEGDPEQVNYAYRGISETHFKYRSQGIIRMKLADTAQIHQSVIADDVGITYTRPRTRGVAGAYKVDSAKSTPFYKTLIPLIDVVAKSGPVLVIMPTRVMAQNLTREIAEKRDYDELTGDLVKLAEERVGAEHLITKVLRKGVAFHHAALPVDLQVAIEQAMRGGVLNTIVSTTVLADGVNLPVKTVIIGGTGSYASGGFNEYISGAKLVNAIGRAGRAGKETEGWIILADNRYIPDNFNTLETVNPSESSLVSQLTSEVALLSLSNTEALMRSNEDALFDLSEKYTSDFASYIWVVANAISEIENKVHLEDIDAFLESTLAWQQMGEDLRGRWRNIARESFLIYEKTPEGTRRRWSQSGMSIASARKLEELSLEILDKFLLATVEAQSFLGPEAGLDLLINDKTLSILFSLPEAPRTDFRPFRSARSDNTIKVDHSQLIKDWVSGVDLPQLVDSHLSSIEDKEYAYEVLGDYITNITQHYLPWLLGVLTDWGNGSPQEDTAEDALLINPQISSYVRYGVNTLPALRLMMNGVVSRQLAIKVSNAFMESDAQDLNAWLQRMKINDFVDLFGAGETEVRELLSYLRARDSSILADFISGAEVELDYRIRFGRELVGEVRFAYLDDATIMGRIGIEQRGTVRCDMPLRLYLDVEEIMQSGLPYEATLFRRHDDIYGVRVKLQTFIRNQEVALEDYDPTDF